MKSIHIKHVPDELADRFQELAHAEGLTQVEFLQKLVNHYKPKKPKSEVSRVVGQIVEALMEENENAREWYDKKYLTPSIVSRATHLIKRYTGHTSINKDTVNQYFEAFKKEIDAHNREQGLADETHNMRAGHARAKASREKKNE